MRLLCLLAFAALASAAGPPALLRNLELRAETHALLRTLEALPLADDSTLAGLPQLVRSALKPSGDEAAALLQLAEAQQLAAARPHHLPPSHSATSAVNSVCDAEFVTCRRGCSSTGDACSSNHVHAVRTTGTARAARRKEMILAAAKGADVSIAPVDIAKLDGKQRQALSRSAKKVEALKKTIDAEMTNVNSMLAKKGAAALPEEVPAPKPPGTSDGASPDKPADSLEAEDSSPKDVAAVQAVFGDEQNEADAAQASMDEAQAEADEAAVDAAAASTSSSFG